MAKKVDLVEVNQGHCLEESGQWLENVDQTHLVLASGNRVLKKRQPWSKTFRLIGFSAGRRKDEILFLQSFDPETVAVKVSAKIGVGVVASD